MVLVGNRATSSTSVRIGPVITGPIPERSITLVPEAFTQAVIWRPLALILLSMASLSARCSVASWFEAVWTSGRPDPKSG